MAGTMKIESQGPKISNLQKQEKSTRESLTQKTQNRSTDVFLRVLVILQASGALTNPSANVISVVSGQRSVPSPLDIRLNAYRTSSVDRVS